MNDRLPWMKFNPAAWQNEPALRMCSLAARGLWIECIAVMHGADPYGHLLVNGRQPTPRQIASITGSTEREVATLLAALEEAGVFSRLDDGTIYSRRMVRDNAIREKARDDGRRGGNPALKLVGGTAVNGGVNPPLVRTLNPEKEVEVEVEVEKKDPPTPRKRGRVSPLQGFDEFWLLYPRRIGKGAAEKAWPKALAACDGDPALILMGLKVATSLDRLDMREEGRFCPHPSTWLNAKRWLDGMEPEPSSQSPLLTH